MTSSDYTFCITKDCERKDCARHIDHKENYRFRNHPRLSICPFKPENCENYVAPYKEKKDD